MRKRIDRRILAAAVLCVALSFGWGSALIAGASSGTPHRSAQSTARWQQVNLSGFGDSLTVEVSALEAFGGYLYAGTTNHTVGARVYRSADGVTWLPSSEPGFGVPHDTAPRAIVDLTVFAGRLYASTGRGDGAAQIWRTADGSAWTPMTVTGFGNPDTKNITVLVVFNGMIYAAASNATTGWQIWRSTSGDNNTWEQVAASQPGTGAGTITGFAVFGGALYMAAQSGGTAQVWRSATGLVWEPVVTDGFGDAQTGTTGGLAAFGGELFVGAGNAVAGAQLWHTRDGIHWSEATLAGFGDPNNAEVEAVFSYQNHLYAAAQNAQTGVELWASPDGKTWQQVNADGFGHGANLGTNWSNASMAAWGQLHVGTSNSAAGGELWRMAQPPSLYLPAVAR